MLLPSQMSVAEVPHYITIIIWAILLFGYNNIIVTPRMRPVTVLYHPSALDSRLHVVSDVVARQRCLALLHSVDRGRCDVTTSREAEPLPFLSQRLRSPLLLSPWYSKVRRLCLATTPDFTGRRLSSDDGWLRDYCYRPQKCTLSCNSYSLKAWSRHSLLLACC